MSSSTPVVATPSIDSNSWYYLYVNGSINNALVGTNLYNAGSTTGAVFLNGTQQLPIGARWQVFPINSTSYSLRPEQGGPNAFLGARYVPTESTAGKTRPALFRGDVADNSAYWTFHAWTDKTYGLSNAQNGSMWYFTLLQNGLCAMDSNITGTQGGKHWSVLPVAKIDDPLYSSILLPGTTVTVAGYTPTATSTPSRTPSSTPSNEPERTDSSTLSTGAKAGIGAGVGIAALIVLVVLALLWRKRRQRKASTADTPSTTKEEDQIIKSELPHDSAVKHEMANPLPELHHGGVQAVEAPAYERPVELPADPIVR